MGAGDSIQAAAIGMMTRRRWKVLLPGNPGFFSFRQRNSDESRASINAYILNADTAGNKEAKEAATGTP